MALSVFNPTTHENRPATEAQQAALYASPEPEADESLPPPMRGLRSQSEGKADDVPLTSGTQIKGLEESEVLIDWETHLYDFNTGEVVPIQVPLSAQFNELRETLGSHIETLESRLAMLEAQLAQQADSLLGFAATIEYLVYLTGKTLPEVIALARERIKTIEAARAAQAEEPYTDEEQEQKKGGGERA